MADGTTEHVEAPPSEVASEAQEDLPSWTPPLRCLVPAEFVASHADLHGQIAESGATLSVSHEEEVPALSDRIVCIDGSPAQQEAACSALLQKLWQDQGISDGEEGLFVLLVPSSTAPAVVGTKGARVLALMKRSGADVKVSREVLPRLCVQPVTIEGSLEQVAVAAIGVSEVLQEIAARGRLHPGDFELQGEGSAGNVGSASATNPGQSDVPSRSAPSRVVFLVAMEAAGRVIGKQGRRIAELQQSTGARISIIGSNGALSGTRCGERLLEIQGDEVGKRAKGVRAALAAMAEEPATSGFGASEASCPLAMLVPTDAIGYVIGKGGQTIKEIMTASGANVTFNQDGPAIAGGRPAMLSGTPEARAEAALAMAEKVDELQARPGSSAPTGGFNGSDAGSSAPNGWQAPRARTDSSRTDVGRMSVEPPMSAPRSGGGYSSIASPAMASGKAQPYLGKDLPSVAWTDRSPAEKALLAGIQACGLLDHRLTMRVPRGVIAHLDEVSRRSGAMFEVYDDEDEDGSLDPDHPQVTAVGPRSATSLAALYVQELLSRDALR